MPLREIILRNSIKWTPCPCVLTAIRSEVAIQTEHWAFCFARNRHVYNTATRAESCSNLLGAARSYLELLESARGYTGLLGSKYSELVRCLELLGAARSCSEILRGTWSWSELLGAAPPAAPIRLKPVTFLIELACGLCSSSGGRV